MSKKNKVEDYAKTHDSVMNNIESILSCLYNIEYSDYFVILKNMKRLLVRYLNFSTVCLKKRRSVKIE